MTRHSPLITISGPPGSGKTSLARALAQKMSAPIVCYDDHETFTRNPPEVLRDWLDRGAPYSEMLAQGFAQALRAAQSADGPVVLDTPLGPLDPALSEIPFISVWLDLPLDIALARKLRQLNDSVPKGREADFTRWIGGYLRAYEEFVHRAVCLQHERLRPVCTHWLDGTSPLEHNAETIISAFENNSK